MMALDDTESGADSDDDDLPTSPDDLAPLSRRPGPSALGLSLPPATHTHPKPSLTRLRFAVLLQTILQDTQTRLVFRAQAVIQSDVLYYVPTGDDLAYPERLEARKGEGLALWTEDENLSFVREGGVPGAVGGFRLPREEAMGSWYPTLKRAVWVLSKLNTYVNVRPPSQGFLMPSSNADSTRLLPQTAIFEDFAGEAVTLCRKSLSTAAVQLAARPTSTKMDGQLFLIRHLLLLKEMVRSVDLVQIERAADFSSVTGAFRGLVLPTVPSLFLEMRPLIAPITTDALVNLLRNTSVIFNPNALFELASKGIPSFAETMTDAKLVRPTTSSVCCKRADFLQPRLGPRQFAEASVRIAHLRLVLPARPVPPRLPRPLHRVPLFARSARLRRQGPLRPALGHAGRGLEAPCRVPG